MADRNKAGREAKKPKQAQNVKTKGQTPPPTSTAGAADGKSPKR